MTDHGATTDRRAVVFLRLMHALQKAWAEHPHGSGKDSGGKDRTGKDPVHPQGSTLLTRQLGALLGFKHLYGVIPHEIAYAHGRVYGPDGRVEGATGTRVLAILGDSLAYGHGALPDETPGALLAMHLSERTGELWALHVEAEPNTTSHALVAQAKRALVAKPDLVFMHSGPNDLGQAQLPGAVADAVTAATMFIDQGRPVVFMTCPHIQPPAMPPVLRPLGAMVGEWYGGKQAEALAAAGAYVLPGGLIGPELLAHAPGYYTELHLPVPGVPRTPDSPFGDRVHPGGRGYRAASGPINAMADFAMGWIGEDQLHDTLARSVTPGAPTLLNAPVVERPPHSLHGLTQRLHAIPGAHRPPARPADRGRILASGATPTPG